MRIKLSLKQNLLHKMRINVRYIMGKKKYKYPNSVKNTMKTSSIKGSYVAT